MESGAAGGHRQRGQDLATGYTLPSAGDSPHTHARKRGHAQEREQVGLTAPSVGRTWEHLCMSENTPEEDLELRHEIDLSEEGFAHSGEAELIGLDPGEGFVPPPMGAADYEDDSPE